MRWPNCIKTGINYEKYISLGDFMATAADVLSDKLPDSAGEDSISFYPVMNSTGDSVRDVIIHHSCEGKFSVRKDGWKLILCAGGGGYVLEDYAAGQLTRAPKRKNCRLISCII